MYNVRNEGKTVPGLLPELTRRGMVDPIETVIDAVGTVVSSLYMSSCANRTCVWTAGALGGA